MVLLHDRIESHISPEDDQIKNLMDFTVDQNGDRDLKTQIAIYDVERTILDTRMKANLIKKLSDIGICQQKPTIHALSIIILSEGISYEYDRALSNSQCDETGMIQAI